MNKVTTCGWCQTLLKRTAHWRYGSMRFCCPEHKEKYIDHLEQLLEPKKINGYPSSTMLIGRKK